MLKIGNFSRIANVSVRLLHYYEEIGLFHPVHIDKTTGYRYYNVEQIQDLNKILALRDSGLSLHQIKRYIDDNVSIDELRGMLKLKMSQLEQTLQEDLLRMRRLDYRLKQLDAEEAFIANDVVIKPIPAQLYLSTRNRTLPVDQFGEFVGRVLAALSAKNIPNPGTFTVLEHSETFPEETFDLEVGFALADADPNHSTALVLSDTQTLMPRTLPAVPQMATLLHIGPTESGGQSYYELGLWIEKHGFEIVGATREVFIEMSSEDNPNGVMEFQLPIQPIERNFRI